MVTAGFYELAHTNASFGSDETVEDTAIAVGEALGERLPRGETEDLAVYLPADVEDEAVVDVPEGATDWSSGEFVSRVAEHADVDEESAREYVDVVLGRVAEVASDQEVERALAQFPDGYESFFER